MMVVAHVLGVDVGGTKVAVASIQGNDARHAVEYPTPLDSTDALLDRIEQAVREVAAKAGEPDAIGVGVPSQIEWATGRVVASVNILNACVNTGVKTLVFTSSIAVYGRGQLPMREDLVPQPEDPYGVSKYAFELDLRAAHEMFGRKGNDLPIVVPISFSEAALGATITVPTMESPVSLRVPPGTKSGRTLRVKGRGAPTKGGSGDLLVTVEVIVPTHLTDAQRVAIEALAASGDATGLRSHLGV